jgi:hypothetical protein
VVNVEQKECTTLKLKLIRMRSLNIGACSGKQVTIAGTPNMVYLRIGKCATPAFLTNI